STVSVKHSFSHGQILISHLRNCLCSNTICALMCFGDWSQLDLFTLQELEEMLKEGDSDEDND
ncbi:hypothetical protein BT96DRAFT_743038, partial [Gymnopus androsaceus JB14]